MLDSNTIKKKLTTEDIIKLCCYLQDDDEVLYDNQNHPIFLTCLDHEDGSSFKMYYYPETCLFHCYSRGTTKDIFEVVQVVKKCDFKESVKFIIQFFHLKDSEGFSEEEAYELTSDWDIFQTAKDYDNIPELDTSINSIQENLLQYFYPLAAPEEWIKEGISPAVMRKYGIRIDTALTKIIIPHRDINGNLIGIRGRSYDVFDVEKGNKYMPVFIQGKIYSHPLGKNLFGLYENKETIQKIKKVCVFEAEKSVMQIATMYGVENCFAVATCGSSFSEEQRSLLLNLGVEEVILAYDADHLGNRNDPDTIEYEKKLLNIAEPLLPYVNVSIIFDYDHILPHKASPSDCGKEKFETLYHQRVKLLSYNEKIVKRRKN